MALALPERMRPALLVTMVSQSTHRIGAWFRRVQENADSGIAAGL
jgi:hypothetical protein